MKHNPSIIWEPSVLKKQKDVIATKFFWGEEIYPLPQNKVNPKKGEVGLLLKKKLLVE